MIFSLFFFGFLFSFAGSITPSMLNMTALKISLEKGIKASNIYALGVSLLVIPQIFIAAFLTKYITDNPKILETLDKVGIVIFIFLTFYFYRESKLETINIKKSKSKKETPFLVGVTLSLLNMFAIPFFSAVIVLLDVFNLFYFRVFPVLFFSAGSFLGTYYILFLYGKFAKKIQQKTGKLTKNINLILAVLTAFAAIFSMVKHIV